MTLTCYQKILELHKLCNFQSCEGEKFGPASNSEIKRWFKQKCIEVNYTAVQDTDVWPEYVKSLVLFPKNKNKRCTLFYDSSTRLIQIEV